MLTWKVFACVAIAAAARISEITYLSFEDIQKTEHKGVPVYAITINRKKQRSINRESIHFISGSLEIKAIDEYMNCFKSNERTGRFFRKLTINKDSELEATNQIIGTVYIKF